MSRAPIKGGQTLGSKISSYLNEKYIEFRIGGIHPAGVRVVLQDISEKMWKGLIGPEFVRLAEENELHVAAAHFGEHEEGGITLEVLLSPWTAMDLARQGWVFLHEDQNIGYYASPRMHT